MTKALTARKTLDNPDRLFDPRDIPPSLKFIPDDLQTYEAASGVKRIQWGWRQWAVVAPRLAKHIAKHGRRRLAGAMQSAQMDLPIEARRTRQALATIAATGSPTDVLQVVAFIQSQQLRSPAPAAKAAPAKKTPRLALVAPPPVVPAKFQTIPEEARPMRGGRPGSPGMTWGWVQWRAVAPALHAHLTRHGRAGLMQAMLAAQAPLASELHRHARLWGVRLAPSSSPDVVALIDHVMQQQGLPPLVLGTQPLPKVPTAKERAKAGRAKSKEAATAVQTPAPLPTPSPAASNATAGHPDPALAALLALPLGAFLPAVKALLPGLQAFVLKAVAEAMAPHHALIADTVRAAMAGPAPAPTAPEPSPEPVAAPEPEKLRNCAISQTGDQPLTADDFAPDGLPSDTAARLARIPYMTPAVPAVPVADDAQSAGAKALAARQVADMAAKLHDAPHDLETQLTLAAKALGIQSQTARETVLCIGLHPKVEQEVDKFYGKSFRFVFKRPDAVKGANDVPASTDAILLCRKGTTRELLALSRRDNLPLVNIQNNSGAVLGALREVFPDSADGLHVR